MGNLEQNLKPGYEAARLKELYNLNILDTAKEERFDRYTRIVADVFKVPIALVSLIDINRQWFKSCIGLPDSETDRGVSFCAHAIHVKDILVIPDAKKDERFRENPLVIGEPGIRFYAGAVLHGPTGKALGTLCIIDSKPREFSDNEKQRLIQFARLVEHELSYNHYLNEMRTKVENSLYYDALTSLPNSRLLKERLEQALQIAKNDQQIAVISLKINQLLKIKKALGMDTAFSFIREIADHLKNRIDESAMISQWEDDSFIIFLNLSPECTLLTKIENILHLFESGFSFGNETYTLSCHIGISVFPDDSREADKLIDNAIYARHLLPADSMSFYRFYSEESTKNVTYQYNLERALIKAVKTDKLTLLYQPKVDVTSRAICGAEALCRWNDNTYGVVSPQAFISIAEQSKLIIQLGELMLRKACLQNKKWQDQKGSNIPISVNVSKNQLLKKNFYKDVEAILKETGLAPCLLDLEITESSLINITEVIHNINAINELGVTFSLDDFGTGFSSLSYLQHLPFKALKIDKSFIDNLDSNDRDAVMVRTILAMAKSLDLITVAEGVETSEQLLFLKAYQCDQIQGYLFSKPLAEDKFTELFSKEVKLTK